MKRFCKDCPAWYELPNEVLPKGVGGIGVCRLHPPTTIEPTNYLFQGTNHEMRIATYPPTLADWFCFDAPENDSSNKTDKTSD